jgi:hypothetical protein
MGFLILFGLQGSGSLPLVGATLELAISHRPYALFCVYIFKQESDMDN